MCLYLAGKEWPNTFNPFEAIQNLQHLDEQ